MTDIDIDTSGDTQEEPTSPEVEQEVAEEELEAASSESQASNESESNEQVEEEELKVQARSEKLQKLIDSKGGEDKFADNIYSIFNSNKALKQEIESLKQQFATRELSSGKEEISIDSDEEYQGFKQEIELIDFDLNSLTDDKQDVISRFNTSKARLAKYEGARQNAEPFERIRLGEKIEEEEERQRELARSWQRLQRDEAKLANKKASYEKKLSSVEEKAKSRARQQQLKAQVEAREASSLESLRVNLVEELATEAGILDLEELEELQEAVRFRAAARISKSGPVDDFEGLIRELASKYLAPHKNQTFKQLSEQKKSITKTNPSLVKKSPISPKPTAKAKNSSGKLSAAEAQAIVDKWARS